MNDKISDKDKKEWKTCLNNKEKLPDKDLPQQEKKTYKTRSIDLHAYNFEDANRVIEDFIYKAFLEKINNTRTYNLDEETLFMEFEDKILNG